MVLGREGRAMDGVGAPSGVAYDSRDGSWKDLGESMSAISFGLAATAILISMFLLMAIFEHLIIPRISLLLRSRNDAQGSSIPQPHAHKIQNSLAVGSVVMPGEDYPTFIAQPAPLPCPREGIHWPSHQHPHIYSTCK